MAESGKVTEEATVKILLTETINEQLENEDWLGLVPRRLQELQPTHVQSAIHIITALKKIGSVTLLSEYYMDIYRDSPIFL